MLLVNMFISFKIYDDRRKIDLGTQLCYMAPSDLQVEIIKKL